MAEYDLGTAKGKIQVEYDGKGVEDAKQGLQGFKKSADNVSAGVDKVGTASTIAGAAIAGGFALAAKTAIDFEKQISAIGAVSGASQQQLDTLRQKALQLGADTTFSASEAAAAMEELAKAGLSVDQIMNGAADATVALAAAGGIQLPQAAELASDAMNSFKLSAGELPHVADLIAGAANASSISVGDFEQSLKQVGAVAKLAGANFDDTATAIALMGKVGIKGSDAGTSLKTMLMNLQPQTKKQTSLMKDLGLITASGANQFFNAQGKLKSLAEVSQVLQTALKGQTEQQKLATLETLFGQDAIRGAATLADAGAKGFNGMADAMGKVTAESVAAQRLNNTAGQLEQLKGSAETAAISFGTLLLPAIKGILKGLTDFANFLNGLSPTTKELVINMGLFALTLAAVAGTAVKIYQFVKAIQAVTIAVRAMNLAWLMSPIGLTVLLIAGLVAAFVILWNKSEAFRNFWKGLWAGIQAAAGAVADWFTGTIVPSLQRAWDQLSTGVKAVGDFIAGIWNWLRDISNAVWSTIGTIIFVIVNKIKSYIDSLITIVDRIRTFFENARAAAADKLNALVSFVASIPGRVMDAIGNLGSLLYNKGKDLVQGLINGITNMLGRLRDKAKELVGVIGRFLPGSPAKEGPLSGKGYVLKRGQRFVGDFARGIADRASQARAAMDRMMGDAASRLPVGVGASVATATAGIAPVVVSPAARPASGGGDNSQRTFTINNLNLNGVWDFSKPGEERKVVARMHKALNDYEREHR